MVDKARNAGDESRAADAAATGDADAPAGVAAPPAPEPGSGGDRDGASSRARCCAVAWERVPHRAAAPSLPRLVAVSLDAETINVNRGAQAVVIVVDSRKARLSATGANLCNALPIPSLQADALDYAEGIIADVPDEASVLLLASHWCAAAATPASTARVLTAFPLPRSHPGTLVRRVDR